MKQLSLFDKFQVFFNNMLQHPLFIIILLVPIIIWLLQKKHGKKAFIIVYLIVILFVLIIGGDLIFKLFDNLMDGLFMVLYFPSFITLFIVVVACSLIALISFFSKKMYKINKVINITSFALVQLLFVLILTIVKAKNINIYKDNALYVNNDVLTLMQLLIGTFTLQILSILIINGINKITDMLEGKNKEEIVSEIKQLEKTKKTKIKTIEIDNSKIGYINVANKSKTSIPKLKPFKFDIGKLESIKLNTKEIIPKEENIFAFSLINEENNKSKPSEKNISKNVFNKPIDTIKSKETKFINEPVKQNDTLKVDEKLKGTVFDKQLDTIKPKIIKSSELVNALKTKQVPPINIKEIVAKPTLVKTNLKEYKEPNLIDNLDILDIQSTLDTVANYKLMKIKLHSKKPEAVNNLQIPNFDMTSLVLMKCKLYKST